MPIYHFKCTEEKKDAKGRSRICGEEFEKIVEFGKAPNIRCTKCHSKKVTRIYKATQMPMRAMFKDSKTGMYRNSP